MNICNIVGTIEIGLIGMMTAALLVCICHKRVMTSATLSGTLLVMLFAGAFYTAERSICRYAPEVWWISILFLLLNGFLLIVDWYMLAGTLIVKDDCLYRLRPYPVFRKYTYAEIEYYMLGWDRTTSNTRFGSRRSSTYEIDVQFCDKAYSTISFRNENSSKAILLREALRAHRCRRKKAQ